MFCGPDVCSVVTDQGVTVSDVVFVLIMVVFFALSVLLVRFCDWLIGPGDVLSTDSDTADELQAA